MNKTRLEIDFEKEPNVFLSDLINQYNNNLNFCVNISYKDNAESDLSNNNWYLKFLASSLFTNKLINDSLDYLEDIKLLKSNLPETFKTRIKEDYIKEKYNKDYPIEITGQDDFKAQLKQFLNKQEEKNGIYLENECGYDRSIDISLPSYKEILNMASKYNINDAINRIGQISMNRVKQEDTEYINMGFLNEKQILILLKYTYLRNKYILYGMNETKKTSKLI